jgi:3-hydroxyisobutyrate dehydrogenase-like beta-hydroxyacid dehydrogenase
MDLGIIGVGNMGWQMAQRLVKAGHHVTAYDPRADVAHALPQLGATAAPSPAAVAKASDATILMVLNSAQADEAIWGENGYAEAATPESILIMMSSLPPAYVAATADRSEGRFQIIDSPVSGGVEGAAAGTLTIMAAGSEAAVETARPVYEALGESIIWLGTRPGLGATMKAVNQAMYFSAMASAAEMVITAAKAGLDPDTVIEVIGRSSGDSWALRNRVPLSWRNDYKSGGSLAVAAKDMTAGLEIAEQLGVDARVTKAAAGIIREAMERQNGEGDDPLLVEYIEARSGVRLLESVSSRNT